MLNEMKALEMFMFKYLTILSTLLISNASYASEPYKVGDVFYCVEKEKVFKPTKEHELFFMPERDLEKFLFKVVDKQTLSFGEGAHTAKITRMSDRTIIAEDLQKRIFFWDNIYNEVEINGAFAFMISAECERF